MAVSCQDLFYSIMAMVCEQTCRKIGTMVSKFLSVHSTDLVPVLFYKIILSRPPTRHAAKSMRHATFIKSTIPSSLSSTTNVATQGKYIARTTQAIISCLSDSPSGASMPTAMSFLKKPINKAVTASGGNPQSLVKVGPTMAPTTCMTPRE